MTVTEMAGPDVAELAGLARAGGRPDRAVFPWDSMRIAQLREIVARSGLRGFVELSAEGQLAASAGRFDISDALLAEILTQGRELFPANAHFFSNLILLALAAQRLDLLAHFLDARYAAPGRFAVTFDQAAPDVGAHVVTITASGTCAFGLSQLLPGVAHSDHFAGQWIGCVPLFAAYCERAVRAPGRLIMNVGDAATVPGLGFCGNDPQFVLVPDNYFLTTRGYAETRNRLNAAAVPWDQRRTVAFWRGATTGVRNGVDAGWHSLPRAQLCILAQSHPERIDAGFSNIVQLRPGEGEEVEAAGLVRGFSPFEEFARHKYQIDIDGNTNAWAGLFQKLLTGSPVLKVASPRGYRQWYYDRLVPWRNYVPVAPDMSDLVEKIEWLRADDQRARAIGEAGRALAESLTYDAELDAACETIGTRARLSQGAAIPAAVASSSTIPLPPTISTAKRMHRQRQPQLMQALYGRNVWPTALREGRDNGGVQGWNGQHPAFRRLLQEAPNALFIDVGVWKGQSTIYVARIIDELQLDGCVIAVDTFLGSPEHWGQEGELFDRVMGRPDLYETFANNVLGHGVADLVVPMPQTSVGAAKILQARGITAGVVHIDASHDYEEVARDLDVYWPLVTPGGFLVGDDYHESWPGVVKAADEFAARHRLDLVVDLPKFIFRK
ncbi:MAG: class I SAM-dependent methyltransferase [Alphaproteobacteria bacterium]|nr:class I SAM-dependent methyltransferase [Alphaproteobacteria bacterium]